MSNSPIPTPPPTVLAPVVEGYQPPEYEFEIDDAEWALIPSAVWLASNHDELLKEPYHQYSISAETSLKFSRYIEEVGFHLPAVTKKKNNRHKTISTRQPLPIGVRHKIVFSLELGGELTWPTASLGSSFESQGYYLLSVMGTEPEDMLSTRLAYVGLLPRGVLGLFVKDPYPRGPEVPDPRNYQLIHTWYLPEGKREHYALTVDTTRGFGNNQTTFTFEIINQQERKVIVHRSNTLLPYLVKGLHLTFGIEDIGGKVQESPEVWTQGVIVESDQLTVESASVDQIVAYLDRKTNSAG